MGNNQSGQSATPLSWNSVQKPQQQSCNMAPSAGVWANKMNAPRLMNSNVPVNLQVPNYPINMLGQYPRGPLETSVPNPYGPDRINYGANPI